MENSCGSCGRSDLPLETCVCKAVAYCGLCCQKSHWKQHRTNCSLFVIRETSVRGAGMFAARRISPGTVILREEPLVVVQHSQSEEDEENCSTLLRTWTAFGQLSVEKQKKFLSLSDCNDFGGGLEKGKLMPKVFGIYGTNSVEVGDNTSWVYWVFSRINHCCAPNAVAFSIKGQHSKELRAFIEIQKGDEIFISYLDLETCVTRNERQERLSKKWKFICNCSVCSLTGQELEYNENIRLEIKKCHEAMETDWTGSLDLEHQVKAFENAQKKLDLCLRLKNELIGQVFSSYLDCYTLSSVVRASEGKLNKQPEEFSEKALAIASIPGLYAGGWLSTGPLGVIADTQGNAFGVGVAVATCPSWAGRAWRATATEGASPGRTGCSSTRWR